MLHGQRCTELPQEAPRCQGRRESRRLPKANQCIETVEGHQELGLRPRVPVAAHARVPGNARRFLTRVALGRLRRVGVDLNRERPRGREKLQQVRQPTKARGHLGAEVLLRRLGQPRVEGPELRAVVGRRRALRMRAKPRLRQRLPVGRAPEERGDTLGVAQA